MSAGYTPTTDNVRDEYVQRFAQWGNAPARWFDRWLNKVKAEAWDDGYECGGMDERHDWNGWEDPFENPYRSGAA